MTMLRLLLAVVLITAAAGHAHAQKPGRVPVKGHTRKDGTYVPPHTRAYPQPRTTAPAGPTYFPPPVPRQEPRTEPRTTPPAPPASPTPYPPEPQPAPAAPPAGPTADATLRLVAGRLPLGTTETNLARYEAVEHRADAVAAMTVAGTILVMDRPADVVLLKEWAAAPTLRVVMVDGPRKGDLLYCRRAHLAPLSPKPTVPGTPPTGR